MVYGLFITTANAYRHYVDICGVATVENVAILGILVEARLCSDDSLVVSQLTTDLVNGYNYHLIWQGPGFAPGPGQFGDWTPLEVYLNFIQIDCPLVVVPCGSILAAYNATLDGKPVININVPCPPIIGPGVACRVTGGTKHLSDKTFPTVRFSTHGGQVGLLLAPVHPLTRIASVSKISGSMFVMAPMEQSKIFMPEASTA